MTTNRLSNKLNLLNPPEMGGSSWPGTRKKPVVTDALLEPSAACAEEEDLFDIVLTNWKLGDLKI